MKKQTSRGRLRLHRETLRSLSTTALGRVAGGTGEIPLTDVEIVPTIGAAPRTNAWTAAAGFPCPVVVCGGGGVAG